MINESEFVSLVKPFTWRIAGTLVGFMGPDGFVAPLSAANVTAASTLTNTIGAAFCDTTAGPFTLKLPPNPLHGQYHFTKKVNATADALTVDGNGHNLNLTPPAATVTTGSTVTKVAWLWQFNQSSGLWEEM